MQRGFNLLNRTRVTSVGLLTLKTKTPSLFQGYRFNSTNTSSKTATSQARANKIIENLKAGSRFVVSSWLVLIAGGATLVTMYLIGTELFSPSGETATYNRVVSMVEKDQISLKMLGYSDDEIKKGGIRLKAYSDGSSDGWTRNRTVQGTKFTGKDGLDHLLLRFFVESTSKIGVVQVEAIEKNYIEQELVFITLDVKGSGRHYLVGGSLMSKSKRSLGLYGDNGFLGVKWGPKKD